TMTMNRMCISFVVSRGSTYTSNEVPRNRHAALKLFSTTTGRVSRPSAKGECMSEVLLSPLPYENWKPTKDTVHLWTQIAGKLSLRYTPHRNHWWNITLLPTASGLTTHPMRDGDTFFRIDFDFLNHKLILSSNRTHADLSFALHDGLSVAEFYANVMQLLQEIGITAKILAKPYGVPMTTPFAQDTEHHSYDPQMMQRCWKILLWTASIMEEFSSEFVGKSSSPQLFWHSFDLAIARYSGKPNPGPRSANPVEAEAYSHEVIAFGFWPGDGNIPAPTYYTYTAAPEPADLTVHPLAPAGARWVSSGAGHMGTFPYDTVREAQDPRATLLEFFRSGYKAGATAAGWSLPAFESLFIPA